MGTCGRPFRSQHDLNRRAVAAGFSSHNRPDLRFPLMARRRSRAKRGSFSRRSERRVLQPVSISEPCTMCSTRLMCAHPLRQAQGGGEDHRCLERLAGDAAQGLALLGGRQSRPADGRLPRQLDALRRVPYAQLVSANRPTVHLPERLERLLGGAGPAERVHIRLQLLEGYRLQLATAPHGQQVAAQGRLVAFQRRCAEALALVGHVQVGGIGKQHLRTFRFGEIPDVSTALSLRGVWDFPGAERRNAASRPARHHQHSGSQDGGGFDWR